MRLLSTIDCQYMSPKMAAAYLRVEGTEAAFIETNTVHALPLLLAALEASGRSTAQVRWVVVTHAHLDHAAGASALMAACPNATLLCHPRAARNLVDPSKLVASAIRVYGQTEFDRLYGTIDPIPAARVRELGDGAGFELGGAPFTVWHTAGHARHHFVVEDPATGSVFTGDAFGLVYPLLQRGQRFALPSTSPIDFDAAEAHRSIDRILGLRQRQVVPTHFGPYDDAEVIAGQLRRWLDVSQAAVEQCIARGEVECEATLRAVLDAELARAAERAGLRLSAEDLSLLELDLKLNAQGLAVVVQRALAPKSAA
jgi:glyoxylase-like metal-dependent hydrolase (beta-lactamase superfamily II)